MSGRPHGRAHFASGGIVRPTTGRWSRRSAIAVMAHSAIGKRREGGARLQARIELQREPKAELQARGCHQLGVLGLERGRPLNEVSIISLDRENGGALQNSRWPARSSCRAQSPTILPSADAARPTVREGERDD